MKKPLPIITCVVLVLAAVFGLRQCLGSFDREHFEAVVAKVLTMSPAAGEEVQFRLDDPSDPASLRRLKPKEFFHRGQGAGNVWVKVTPDGELKVVIQTKDMGHSGEYGFAYSDTPLVPSTAVGGWSYLDVPGRLKQVQPDMKIDDKWWKVLNNLD